MARADKPEDRQEIGDPRGSQIISGLIDHSFLIGSKTALTGIGRRVETMPVH
ncbi:hypothetical protein K6W36_15245 [Acetobacter senegalensis]|uniref:hypothetical protein n=1 Tax=Acetobacter senegalensis TaxID=446692 RepID=UPI001EDB013B|nr:hypothetical protein [Acetobacter senegalensis]MCG4261913.1 hypothetical protein [Acetobacter senegalensis]